MAKRILPVPGVYRITCTTTGKFYIGSSSKVSHRWTKHKNDLSKGRHHSEKLQRAWDKYGAGAFVFEALELTPTPAEALMAEQILIDTLHPTLNVLTVAGSCLGRPASEKQKSAARAAQLGKPKSEETRRKISEALRGRKITKEALLSRATSPLVAAHLVKLHEAHKGTRHTAEHIEKIRVSCLAYARNKLANTLACVV